MEQEITKLKIHYPNKKTNTLKAALNYTLKHAQKHDTILFSPACASFDQFSNFEERGNTFKQLIKEIENET